MAGSLVTTFMVCVSACSRPRAAPSSSPPASSSASPILAPADAFEVGVVLDAGGANTDASTWAPRSASSIDGPHEDLTLDAGRPIYYALPRGMGGPFRLVGHVHGMCGSPSYACGEWIGAGTDVGIMVCPTGNARCGDSPYSPSSWEAPTWPELVATMDADLERAVAKVEARRPGSIRKDGAILTGYSRGAYAAPVIARRHPDRWRYLVLIEANVQIDAEGLERSGVRAVALVAGEQGNEIVGMQKTQARLEQSGFPSRLFVMRRTGHLYSDDMDYVMHDALAFVLANERATDGGAR